MTDILLFMLFTVSFIYCSDLPAIIDISFFIRDTNSLAYGVGMSVIAAYIFYFIQTFPAFLKKKIKYGRFLEMKLADIDTYMADTIRILTRCECNMDFEKMEQKIRENLGVLNVFEDGARVYRDQKELLIIDALLENEVRIHQEIMELFSLDILGKRTVELLMEVDGLEVRKFAQTYGVAKPGNLETVEQQRNESAGGAMSYNIPLLQQILERRMIQYIATKKKVSTYRKKFGGSGGSVLLHYLLA